MARTKNSGSHRKRIAALLLALLGTLMPPSRAGQARAPSRAVKPFPKPKLVVLLGVDQARAEHVVKTRVSENSGRKVERVVSIRGLVGRGRIPQSRSFGGQGACTLRHA